MMPQKKAFLFPKTQKVLAQMGEQIKLARLRRKISVNLLSERSRVSRTTIWAIENGSPSVSMGAYAAVLNGLNGMDKDLLLIAKDDVLGRTIQDLNLPVRKRAPKLKGDEFY